MIPSEAFPSSEGDAFFLKFTQREETGSFLMDK